MYIFKNSHLAPRLFPPSVYGIVQGIGLGFQVSFLQE